MKTNVGDISKMRARMAKVKWMIRNVEKYKIESFEKSRKYIYFSDIKGLEDCNFRLFCHVFSCFSVNIKNNDIEVK